MDPFGGNFDNFMKKAMGGKGSVDRENPSITGAGDIEGGKFKSLTIAGSGTVNGDVEAKTVEVSGAGEIDGNLNGGSVSASGSFSVSGSLEADAFDSAGSSSVGGSVKAGKVFNGGAFEVGRDIEAKSFESHGAFGVGGSIEADDILIELGGDSHAHAIKGNTVKVRRNKSAGGSSGTIRGGSVISGGTVVTGGVVSGGAVGYAEGGKVSGGTVSSSVSGGSSGGKFKLKVKTLEGDKLDLEATVADLVKGAKVIIGKNCKIETVEYTDSIEVHEKAQVKKQVKK
ncbi:MAG: hypothetical protein KIS92_20450 [Planctomycetota bacterium]|nr:hypothetical protein [Planctomycetota bacterium]